MHGVQFPAQAMMGIFLFATALGPTQPPIQKVPEAFTQGIEHSWHEDDHSALSSAQVKYVWS